MVSLDECLIKTNEFLFIDDVLLEQRKEDGAGYFIGKLGCEGFSLHESLRIGLGEQNNIFDTF